MTLQSIFNSLAPWSISSDTMANAYSAPSYDEMDTDADFPLLPPAVWNVTYLSVPGVLPIATRLNPRRVTEVFTTATAPPVTNTTAPLSASPQAPPSLFRVSAPPITPYDGQSSNLRAFCSQLYNHLQEEDIYFPNEMSRVRFAYRCLGPGALAKMRSSFRCLEDPTIDPEIKTLTEFIEALKRQCQDPGLEDKATRAVETMTQKNLKFHEFITIFEDNMADSSYAQLDKETWKTMLKRRLSYKLRDILLSASDVPSEYHAFVAYLRKKDAAIHEMRAAFPTSTQPRLLNPPRSNFSHPYTSLNPVPASTERTVSQGGTAMDLDFISRQKGPDGRLTDPAKDARRKLGRCIRCNEQGHFAINCHLRTKSVAAMSTTEYINEETESLKG